jgi:protease I
VTYEGTRVAVLVEDGYQELELWHPVMRFREEYAEVDVAGPDADTTYTSQLTYPVLPTVSVTGLSVTPDVVVVPGHGAGERLAADQDVVTLLKSAHAAGSVIGALGTGAAALTAAGIALPDAGVNPVAVAENVVTGRGADDLPAFIRAICDALDTVATDREASR